MQHVQALVPEFEMTSPQLLGMVDEITDRASQALVMGQAALALTSGDARQALVMLLEHVKHIGFTADMSVADRAVDLAEVWGVVQQASAAPGQRDAA